MNKTWLVLKNEFLTTVLRRSFLITLFGLPLVGAIIFGVVGMINRDQPGQVAAMFSPAPDTLPAGLVDHSGLITTFPSGQSMIQYGSEGAARQDLAVGRLSGIYIISADYLKSGEMEYIRPDFNPISAFDQSGSIQNLINQNLLKNTPELARLYTQSLNIQRINLNPKPEQAQESAASMILPSAITVLFYILLVGASSLLMNSITNEKENRVIEILMSSVDARQLLLGKIIALGLVGLLQLAVWLGSSLLLLSLGQKTNMLGTGIYIPANLFGWALLYFLGGYLLYASLMAGVGAMATNLREGSQMTSLIMMPMIIPLALMGSTTQDPNGTISMVLSLIPFTSPVSMIARIASTDVPLWQSLLGLALLVCTAVWIIRMVAAMFRSQVILAGQPFTRQRFFKVFFGRLD